MREFLDSQRSSLETANQVFAAFQTHFVHGASAAVLLPRGSFSKAVVYLEAAASVTRRRVASSECRSSPRSSPPLSWTPWIARRTSRSRVSTWGAPRDYTLCRAAAIDEVLVVVVVGLEAAPVRVVAEFPIGAITPTPFSL